MNNSLFLIETHTDSVTSSSFQGENTLGNGPIGSGLKRLEEHNIPISGYALLGAYIKDLEKVYASEGPYTKRIVLEVPGGMLKRENAQEILEVHSFSQHYLFIGGYWGACLSNVMQIVSEEFQKSSAGNRVYFHLVKPFTATGINIDITNPNDHTTNFMCWQGFRGNNIHCYIDGLEIEDRKFVSEGNKNDIELMIWSDLEGLRNFIGKREG